MKVQLDEKYGDFGKEHPPIDVTVTLEHLSKAHVFVGTDHSKRAFEVFLPKGNGLIPNTQEFKAWLSETRFKALNDL